MLPGYFKNLVNEISKIPGIGTKTALRIALFLLKNDKNDSLRLANSIVEALNSLQICYVCGILSEGNLCKICTSHERDHSVVCVVESFVDFLAIERAGFYKGVYHILGGLVSPIEGIDQNSINIEKLYGRLKEPSKVKELILALPSSLEGDATVLLIKNYIDKMNPNIKLTRVAMGLPVGVNPDYADDLTLIKSFENRVNVL